jgi:hypothetical protein
MLRRLPVRYMVATSGAFHQPTPNMCNGLAVRAHLACIIAIAIHVRAVRANV